jgi:hypothetical protein
MGRLLFGQESDPDPAAVWGRGRQVRVAGELVRQVLQRGGVTELPHGQHIRVERGDRLAERGQFRLVRGRGGRITAEDTGSSEVRQVPRADSHHGARLPRLDPPLSVAEESLGCRSLIHHDRPSRAVNRRERPAQGRGRLIGASRG